MIINKKRKRKHNLLEIIDNKEKISYNSDIINPHPYGFKKNIP